MKVLMLCEMLHGNGLIAGNNPLIILTITHYLVKMHLSVLPQFCSLTVRGLKLFSLMF